mmetsp:Transcript_32247/g.94940  ORF Transcript_32247/g.94940 Transcript_32247/m.94940 type:complete len:238 (+) Transcript_32247:30-743(+)
MKRVAFHPTILQPLRRTISAHAVSTSTDVSSCVFVSCSSPALSTGRPTARCFSSNDDARIESGSRRGGGGRRVRNFRLEAIKKEGLTHLDQTAQEASAKAAAKPLFVTEEESGPTARQVKEASRIHQVLDEAIDQFSKKEATFTIRGDPIMILDVEVSQDLRHARAYWTLPFTLIDLPDDTRAEVKRRMQTILEKRGGALQALVHSKLRFYYPPRLRFVPADDSVLSMAMKDLLRDR